MNKAAQERARGRAGVVIARELGTHPRRAAARAGLVRLQPGAFVAATQPLDVAALVAVVREAWDDREVYVLGAGALWLHGAGVRPSHLALGIPAHHELAADAPLTVRRLAPAILEGSHVRHGVRVVALEVAMIQLAENLPWPRTLEQVEELVRSRRTTLSRLRARCRRGFKGSAAVRRACDELAGGSVDADVRKLRDALRQRGVELEAEVRFAHPDAATAYADLFHRRTRTVLEVDGLSTHATRGQFRVDRRRDRWMRRLHGVTTLRIDVTEIREDLDALADEVAELLALSIAEQASDGTGWARSA